MKRLNNMPIRTRMMVGYGLFMLPLIFLFVTILSSKNSLIDSARQEIAGTRLITLVASAQADLLLGKNSEATSDIADRLARQDLTLGGTVGRPVVDQALSNLRNAATPRRDASAALVGLIGKLADGANLTLDTDLDSFYVMDATIGKAPAAMDEIAGLADELKSTAGQTTLSSDAQVAALLRLARARMQLEGLAASLDTAFNANASGKTRAALAGTLGELQSVTTTALAALEEAMKTRRDHAAQADVIAAPALTALRGFGAAGSAELIRLLEDRVSGLRWALAADLAVSGTLFLIAIGFGFVTIQRGTIRPLIQMTDSMRHLASGDLDAVIPAQDRKDEIGGMAQAMLVFQENGRSARALSEAATREQARKERQQELMAHHTTSFGDAATAIMDSLAAASSVMRTAAGSMTEAANGVHGAATQTATGASAMAQDVTSVASALEEMTASVAEISRQVTTAADMSNQAVARTVTSQESIRALTDSTGRIGEMLGLINQIAGQTNLLALNATIEAARAGDAGRGFAVVAGEVKALAVQTAKATLDIGGQIESVRTATDQAIQAMADIASMIHRMNEASTAISAAVEQQSATAREISGNLHGISTVTAQASSAMGHVETLANQAGELSQNVATSATTIDEEAARLRREVNGFLDAVKQAAHAEAA